MLIAKQNEKELQLNHPISLPNISITLKRIWLDILELQDQMKLKSSVKY